MYSKYYQMLGQKIRAIRLAKNYKQLFLATELEIDVRSYRKYENGQSKIPTESLEKIAHLFKMRLEDILRFGEDTDNYADKVFKIPKEGSDPKSLIQEKNVYDRWINEKNEEISVLKHENVLLRNENQELKLKIRETEAKASYLSNLLNSENFNK